MRVDVVAPSDCTGSIIGDLESRRGQIESRDMRNDAAVIVAMVPLANMFGYDDALRFMSHRRATFAMRFDRYAPVPLPGDDPFPPAVGLRA